ncbi:DUF1761 domain-containing protein [Candidatus Pacearchaeota archaeon]|nr:DUF1761 domain-containing protein [Candidatus Pacearchaeota archaeon]
MMIDLSVINHAAVFVSAIIAFFVGWLWFSSALFGNMWVKLNKFSKAHMNAAKKKGMKGMWSQMLLSFLSSVVMIYVLALLLVNVGATTIGAAVVLAFTVWLGFFAAIMINMVLWEGKPFALYLISVGHHLAVLVISAVILVMW